MSNERPNEFLPWRVTLTKIDALPGHGLDDKEQSWDRLAERLRNKPRRRGIVWWMAGVAAACLVVVFLLPGTIFRDRPVVHNHVAVQPPAQPQPVTRAPSRPQSNPVAVGATLPAHANSGANSNYGDFAAINDKVKSRIPAPRTTAPRTTAPRTLALRTPDLPMRALPLFTAVGPAIGPDIATAVDTPVFRAVLSAPKKQLKVVCYNEINNPASKPPQLAVRDPESLRISLGRMTNMGSGDPIAESNDVHLLTIKLIPKNN